MVEKISVETARGSIVSPQTLQSVKLYVLPEYKHRDPIEVEKSINEVSHILDKWADDYVGQLLPALKDLRSRLAKLQGGDKLVKQIDATKSTASDSDFEPSVSVPVSVPKTKNKSEIFTTSLPVISESGQQHVNEDLEYQTLSESPALVKINSEPVETVKNSLEFSTLVGSGLTDLQAQANRIRQRNQVSAYVKDIMVLLCKLSMY